MVSAPGRLAWPGAWRWLLMALLTTAWVVGCRAVVEEAMAPPQAAWHLAQAQWAWQPVAAWAAPPETGALDAELAALSPPAAWQPVALPHQHRATSAEAFHAAGRPGVLDQPKPADAAPEVLWYRLGLADTQALAALGDLRLYLPRWHTRGGLAVYANGRLLWQTLGSRMWNGFYRPVWVDLSSALAELRASGAQRPPLRIDIRLARVPGDGSTLSSAWLGPASQLSAAYGWRGLLQSGVAELTIIAYLAMGVLALGYGALARQPGDSRVYLWFAAVAFLVPLQLMGFVMRDDAVPLFPDDLLTWLWIGGQLFATTCVMHYMAALLGQPTDRLLRASLWLAVGGWLGMGLLWLLPGLPQRSLQAVAIVCGVLAFGIYVSFLLRTAWRVRSPVALGFMLLCLLYFVAALHDLPVLAHTRWPEHVLLTPYTFPTALMFFLGTVLMRYRRALDTARQAHEHLQAALHARELELAQAHADVLQAQREQTLAQERQRMVREMHDGVGSSLVLALRMLEARAPDPAGIAQVLNECMDDLKLSIDALGHAPGDLGAVLGSLRYRLQPRLNALGVQLRWRLQPLPALPWLGVPQASHVLRILQEVLTNIVKHGGATELELGCTPAEHDGASGLRIELADNGVPFAPEERATASHAGRGLGNIRARTQALGGACAWSRQPDGRNAFSLWLPLAASAQPLAD